MIEVVNKLLQYKREGRDTLLVGIVESSGSLPRKKGAYMLLDAGGRIAGTVGGGNLEYQAICAGLSCFDTKTGRLREHSTFSFLDYRLNLEDSAKLGMVCGGSARLLLYPVYGGEDRLSSWVLQWKEALWQGHSFPLVFYDVFGKAAETVVCLEDLPVVHRESVLGDGTVYIFGAGHLAGELVPLLSHLEFRCVVLDDRPEFADSALFPEAREVKLVEFEHLSEFVSPGKGDYLVVMTRGHRYDLQVEAFALTTKADYIGVVGSRKKTAYVNQQLREVGFREEDLARITTPIGLEIGSETPAEIAVSIAAQMVQVRSDRRRKL